MDSFNDSYIVVPAIAVARRQYHTSLVTSMMFEMAAVGTCLRGGEPIDHLWSSLSTINAIIDVLAETMPRSPVLLNTELSVAVAASINTHRRNLEQTGGVDSNPNFTLLIDHMIDWAVVDEEDFNDRVQSCMQLHCAAWAL